MARSVVWALYALLVGVWSSTWVAIKIGLEGTPPLLGAGIRFVVAGLALLVIARVLRRSLSTDWLLAAVLGALPFACAYGLIYWGEQYVPSGLAAVLFGVLPIYVALMASVALADEPLRARLLVGVFIALGGLVLAFGESVALGEGRYAVAGALACVCAPLASAVGNVSIKRRVGSTDALVLNGWAMLGGGLLLLVVSAVTETWGDAVWYSRTLGSIAYLAALGTAFSFVVLTLLLRELPAVTISFIALLLPFGALVFGALLYSEALTLPAVAGAALVAAGIVVAQWPGRVRASRMDAARAGTLRPSPPE